MIEIVTQVEPKVWDRYMTGHPAGHFGHSYAWAESLAKVYDLPARRWAAYAGPRMEGGWPLISGRSPIGRPLPGSSSSRFANSKPGTGIAGAAAFALPATVMTVGAL